MDELITERTTIRAALISLRKRPHVEHPAVMAELRQKMIQIDERISMVCCMISCVLICVQLTKQQQHQQM